jgi:hypothetical protein
MIAPDSSYECLDIDATAGGEGAASAAGLRAADFKREEAGSSPGLAPGSEGQEFL